MSLRSQLGFLRRRLLHSAYPRRVSLENRGPIVSFSFDDFPRTAFTVGGRILKSYGVRGTYYTAMGLMNTFNELGDHFCRKDLDALMDDGHELASHTFSHISCCSVACSTFRADVMKGRRAIEDLTGQYAPGNFAFPFGEVTLRTKRAIGAEMASCRSVWSGFNGPEVDLNLLRANSLYGDRDKYDQVRKLILDNERRNSWLIFYSHDVRHNPSRFGCTPALLEFAVSFASHQRARILTVAEVVTELVACPRRSDLGWANCIATTETGSDLKRS